MTTNNNSTTTNTPEKLDDVEMTEQVRGEEKKSSTLLGRKRNINGSFVNKKIDDEDASNMDVTAEYEETNQDADSEFDNSEDEDDDEEDKELKYYEGLYNSAGLFHFCSSNARVEKPSSIMLRACNIDANWNLKEVLQLRDELRRFYEMTRRRCKLIKRDCIKLKQYEEDNGKYYVSRKNAKPFASSSSPDKQLASLMKQRAPNKICGVVNSRGKPCQRTGFCPFHHRLSTKQQDPLIQQQTQPQQQDKQQEESSSVVLMTEQVEGTEFKQKIQLSRTQADRELDMQFSVLLIAAAAIERREIDQEEERKAQQPTIESSSTTNLLSSTPPQQQQQSVQNTTNTASNLVPPPMASSLSSFFPAGTLTQQPQAPVPPPQQAAPSLLYDNTPKMPTTTSTDLHSMLETPPHFIEPTQSSTTLAFLQQPAPPTYHHSLHHHHQAPPIPSMNQLKNLFSLDVNPTPTTTSGLPKPPNATAFPSILHPDNTF